MKHTSKRGVLAVAFMAACGAPMTARATNVTVTAAGQFVAFGDSISDPQAFSWPTVSGGLVDQINAQFTQGTTRANGAAATGSIGTVAFGSTATVAASAPTVKALNYVADHNLTAQSGWTTGDILSHLTSALATYHPTTVLLHVGINDIANGGNPNPGGSFQTNIPTILDQIHTAYPSAQILLVGLMAHWEQWDSVTGWGPNTDDASLATANTFLANQASSRSTYVHYVDVRTPLLPLEQANNSTPVVGTVHGVQDGVYIFQDTHGVHPNTNLKLLMAQQCMQIITVTP